MTIKTLSSLPSSPILSFKQLPEKEIERERGGQTEGKRELCIGGRNSSQKVKAWMNPPQLDPEPESQTGPETGLGGGGVNDEIQ